MGRQWLQAKRDVANLKKGQVVSKLAKEIMVAAKLGGGADVDSNARLAAAVEKAKRASVTRDAIERAIKKGAGIGDDKLVLEHAVFEGYAPHKVPVIVEALTDNPNRTAPEIRLRFKQRPTRHGGQQQVSLRSRRPGRGAPSRTRAPIWKKPPSKRARTISSRSPTRRTTTFPRATPGARFITERTAVHAVSMWLKENGWTVSPAKSATSPKAIPS